MKAYHFLQTDMTSAYGSEPPWRIGETRRFRGTPVLCERGYHSSPSWLDALTYAPGPVACLVDVSRPAARDGTISVSRRRTLIAAADVTDQLRAWALDCAEHVQHLSPDAATCNAVTRRFLAGQATQEELAAARYASTAARHASTAAWDASTAARYASTAARYASTAARYASTAARYASTAARYARDDERGWQRARLAEYLDAAVRPTQEGVPHETH